jgi:hypothetical protein
MLAAREARMRGYLLVIGLAACDGSDDTDTNADTDTDLNTDPRFESDIVPLFGRSCGSGSNSCHSAVAYLADPVNACNGWLALEDAPLGSEDPSNGASTGCPDQELYERLVGLQSWECLLNGYAGNGNEGFSMTYVVPGDLDQSALWQKMVSGGVLCDAPTAGQVSQRMPLGSSLSEEELAMFEAWILNGAQRD